MKMKSFVPVMLVLATIALFAAPAGKALVCVDGCSTLALSVGNFVKLGPASSSSCTACGSGSVSAYKITKTSTCGANDNLGQGTFCSTSSTAGNQTYEVNSIGSGCSSDPQGCVRLCVCP